MEGTRLVGLATSSTLMPRCRRIAATLLLKRYYGPVKLASADRKGCLEVEKDNTPCIPATDWTLSVGARERHENAYGYCVEGREVAGKRRGGRREPLGSRLESRGGRRWGLGETGHKRCPWTTTDLISATDNRGIYEPWLPRSP